MNDLFISLIKQSDSLGRMPFAKYGLRLLLWWICITVKIFLLEFSAWFLSCCQKCPFLWNCHLFITLSLKWQKILGFENLFWYFFSDLCKFHTLDPEDGIDVISLVKWNQVATLLTYSVTNPVILAYPIPFTLFYTLHFTQTSIFNKDFTTKNHNQNRLLYALVFHWYFNKSYPYSNLRTGLNHNPRQFSSIYEFVDIKNQSI